jgi:hypothetical protein
MGGKGMENILRLRALFYDIGSLEAFWDGNSPGVDLSPTFSTQQKSTGPWQEQKLDKRQKTVYSIAVIIGAWCRAVFVSAPRR